MSYFLTSLVIEGNVAKNTQKTALNALVHFYEKFLKSPLEGLTFESAKKQRRTPEVFTHQEAKSITSMVMEPYRLMTDLMYDSGLRISECGRLRVKDIDFGFKGIIVRNGKGDKDRTTLLPNNAIEGLKRQIEKVKLLHEEDLANNCGKVYLPNALEESGTPKHSGCHTFRHSFATRLLQKGYDIRTIQTLMGHADVKSTEIYTHIVGRGGFGVISPTDDD